MVLLGLLLSGCGTVAPPPGATDYFPLAAGTRWAYAAHAETADGGGIVTNDAVLRGGVTEAVVRDDLTAAVVRGFPLDVALWTTDLTADSETLLLHVPAGQFHRLATNELARLRAPADGLLNLVGESTLLLPGPLAPGLRYGDFEQAARADHFYGWYVAGVTRERLRGIRGVSPWRKRLLYRLEYKTCPDEQTLLFSPGLGIVAYAYHHHGTACDLTLQLREFQRPPR